MKSYVFDYNNFLNGTFKPFHLIKGNDSFFLQYYIFLLIVQVTGFQFVFNTNFYLMFCHDFNPRVAKFEQLKININKLVTWLSCIFGKFQII